MLWREPQRERNWYPKYGTSQYDATVQSDGTYLVEGVRDFQYGRDGTAREQWMTRIPVDPARVVRTWYMLEPFTSWDAIAHPYFIFEFDSGSTLCFTIEGKRLNNTPYSGWKGMLRAYELGYIWITEHDCLTMPLTHGAQALYLYPMTLSPDESARLMRGFLDDTHQLFERPEFYHTILNNCTIRFAHTLERQNVRRMPLDLSWYLPGWSDYYLARLGLIDVPRPLRSSARDLVARKEKVWTMLSRYRERPMREIFKLLRA